MAITYHPRAGCILLCDFSKGFKEPEMVKRNRPVLVIAGRMEGRGQLVTVVSLSTTAPEPIRNYHYKLPKKSLPQTGNFQEQDTWVKGDMVYSVGFHRLDLIKLGKRDTLTGKRLYFKDKLGREHMKDVYTCVLHGLNLGDLGQHL